jgi:RNA polymerase sigma-70 factor (ECF subfamily)
MKADLELVEEVKKGNQLAFQELVMRHQRALFRICFRFTRDEELAEDVVQEALIKAYQKISTFEGRSAFKSWLVQIATNTARNKLRTLKGEHVHLERVQLATNAEGSTGLEKADLKAIVRDLVDTLPEKQRTALVLRVFEDMSFKEIASVMESPYDTVKANYRHAIVSLRKHLAEAHVLQEWNNTELDHPVVLSAIVKDVEH